MKRLLSYLLIPAMAAAIYSTAAAAAPPGHGVSLSYEADLRLSVAGPRSSATDMILLPAATPAALMNSNYSLIMDAGRSGYPAYAGRDRAAGMGAAGWRLVNTDPRALRLQPTYFWSGNELGIRTNVWNADRFLLLTFRVRY